MKSEDNYRVLPKTLTGNKPYFCTYQLKSSKGLQVAFKGIEQWSAAAYLVGIGKCSAHPLLAHV